MSGCGIPHLVRSYTCRALVIDPHMATGIRPRAKFTPPDQALEVPEEAAAARAGSRTLTRMPVAVADPAPAVASAQAAVEAAAVFLSEGLHPVHQLRPAPLEPHEAIVPAGADCNRI